MLIRGKGSIMCAVLYLVVDAHINTAYRLNHVCRALALKEFLYEYEVTAYIDTALKLNHIVSSFNL